VLLTFLGLMNWNPQTSYITKLIRLLHSVSMTNWKFFGLNWWPLFTSNYPMFSSSRFEFEKCTWLFRCVKKNVLYVFMIFKAYMVCSPNDTSYKYRKKTCNDICTKWNESTLQCSHLHINWPKLKTLQMGK
jgi:hypothetical protein